jgi:hypothetical protein
MGISSIFLPNSTLSKVKVVIRLDSSMVEKWKSHEGASEIALF